jgi:putative endonuclease
MKNKKIIKNIYKEPWYLYILSCKNGNFYTGITIDIERRFQQHVSGKGAKYTKNNGVVRILYSEDCLNHHDAAVREVAIKKLSRLEKKKLIKTKLKIRR